MKPIKTWVVIADGARARVVLNQGPGSGFTPAINHDFEAPNAPSRELVTDRPGRNRDRSGGKSHATAPRVDWHRFEKHRFARDIAAMLEDAARRNAFDRLILVAPPETLGDLRKELGPHAQGKVTSQLGKDLTHFADRDLGTHLGAVMVP